MNQRLLQFLREVEEDMRLIRQANGRVVLEPIVEPIDGGAVLTIRLWSEPAERCPSPEYNSKFAYRVDAATVEVVSGLRDIFGKEEEMTPWRSHAKLGKPFKGWERKIRWFRNPAGIADPVGSGVSARPSPAEDSAAVARLAALYSGKTCVVSVRS